MFFSVHQELSEKQKPPTHQGGGFIPPAEILFGEFPHHTSSGTFVPDQGHLSSPLPGCQTRLRVVPDVGRQPIEFARRRNKILCHSKIGFKSSAQLYESPVAEMKKGRIVTNNRKFLILYFVNPSWEDITLVIMYCQVRSGRVGLQFIL